MNKEEIAKIRAIKWNAENKERRKAIQAKYQAKPEVKARRASQESKRRALKLSQGCTCCTKEDFNLVFTLAGMGEEALHVDHIVPLTKGGLHCTSNMQLLTAFDNRSKSNRLEVN